MPGPDDKTSEVWKEQDTNPERCGFCGSTNIAKQGDFFRCNACGHDWPAAVDKAGEPVDINTRVDRLEKVTNLQTSMIDVLLAHPNFSIQDLTDQEAEIVVKYNLYRRESTVE